ncbi:unnamed protein product [Sympodiomycopsis kandeliae]
MSSALSANAKEASQVQSSQAKQPTDLERRIPISIDTLAGWLNNTLLRTPVLLAIPALLWYYDTRINSHKIGTTGSFTSALLGNNGVNTPTPTYGEIKNLLLNEYKWVGRFFIFGILKALNHHLNRYFANLGQYQRDRPDWSKEVVVITGGSAGIGKAAVEVLSHKKKAKIAVLDMAPPTYAPAPKGAPAIQYYKTDVSDPAQVHAAAEQIRASLGEPTIVINNAGIGSGDTIVDIDLNSALRSYKVNTFANFVTVKEFLPAIIKKNHGHIVTVASSASFMSLPQMAEYTTSKSAALAFHEVLRGELRARYFAPKIRTSIIAPTKVRTALGDGMEDHKMPFFHPNLEPIEIGRKITETLDSGLSQYHVMPGLMKLLPFIRAAPDWFRRSIEVVGETDQQVSNSSVKRAMSNGYGNNWDDAGKKNRDEMLQRLSAEAKYKK